MTAPTNPKISIVTPTWNSAKTVGATVASLLKQDFRDFEHIVVDNLSSDGTISLVENLYAEKNRKHQLRIHSEKDNGISDAFNKGVLAAKAPIVVILNSDDHYFEVNTLSKVWDHFQETNADIVHGDMIFADPVFGDELRKPLLCDIRKGMPYNHPTVFVKKSLYDQVGIFDDSCRLIMDYEWFMRVAKTDAKISYLPQVITFMDGNGVSATSERKTLTEIEKALKMHGLWNANAKFALDFRKFKLMLKNIFIKYNILAPVKVWRKWKFTYLR